MSAVVRQHPRLVELVARRKLRAKVERAVTRLIAVLDELDGDPEAEPWLGAPETAGGFVVLGQGRWTTHTTDDREAVDEDGGDILDGGDDDQVDGEPSLGAAENPEDQRRWAAGNLRDLEDDRDAEPDERPLPRNEAEMETWYAARTQALEETHG